MNANGGYVIMMGARLHETNVDMTMSGKMPPGHALMSSHAAFFIIWGTGRK
jgi:hypothetical protein